MALIAERSGSGLTAHDDTPIGRASSPPATRGQTRCRLLLSPKAVATKMRAVLGYKMHMRGVGTVYKRDQ